MRDSELSLTLLVLGVLADDANDTATVNHLALVADRLYGCTDLHGNPQFQLLASSLWLKTGAAVLFSSAKSWRLEASSLPVAVDDTAAVQVIRAQLDGYAVAGEDTDEVLAHAP